MERSEVLNTLNNARLAHLRWIARAKGLVAGLPLDKDQEPALQTDCEFGRWYYGPGRALEAIPAYRSLALPHEMLHQIYARVFGELYAEDDRSLPGKLFGSAKAHRQKHLDEARCLLPSLRDQSEVLLKNIDLLEKGLLRIAQRQSPTSTAMADAERAEQEVRKLLT